MKIKQRHIPVRIFAMILAMLIMNKLFSCNIKGQRTRSFVLTQDSTFIGAWGGEMIKSHGLYIPTTYKAFQIMFIYSKNNKIYVLHEPQFFEPQDSTKELQSLLKAFTNEYMGATSKNFTDEFILESETVISQEFTDDSWYKYEINKDNSLSYYYFTKTLTKEGKIEDFTFKPYYFKSIPNPEDKK